MICEKQTEDNGNANMKCLKYTWRMNEVFNLEIFMEHKIGSEIKAPLTFHEFQYEACYLTTFVNHRTM